MEEFNIKLEILAPVMNNFIQKLQDFDSSEDKRKHADEILSLIEDLRLSLSKAFEDDTKSQTQIAFGDKVDRIFNEFDMNVNCIKQKEFQKLIFFCKSLASSIMKIIGKKNCGIMVVDMYFRMCLKLLNELSQNVKESDVVLQNLLHFQLLVKGFLTSVKVLKKFWYTILKSEQKCSVMLCLCQSLKTLVFLGKIIVERDEHLLMYLLNRLKQCFYKFFDSLYNNEVKHVGSEFITLMDSCLNLLNQISLDANMEDNEVHTICEAVSSLKLYIDELLCNAMTVGHIAKNDSNLIKTCSQKVLDEYDNLCTVANGANTDIEVSRLSNALCKLEEIVNTAVLNVVLDVFNDVNDPLRNLIVKCTSEVENSWKRSANDFENEISVFDEQMDKIMHVGLFAISCSTDVRKILQIRNCLASLESMEAEIITAIISLYLNPKDVSKLNFKILFQNWLEEMNQMKNVIDLILDPAAFCQVVEKRISSLVYELEHDSLISIEKIKCKLEKIISFTKKLIKTLFRNISQDGENYVEEAKKLIENLQFAHQECEASSCLLQENISAETICKRVVKRAVLVISSISALVHYFKRKNSQSSYTDATYAEESSSASPGECTKLRNDKSAVIAELNANNMDALTPYINKGKMRTKERTILYNTPKNMQGSTQKDELIYKTEKRSWRNSIRSDFRSRFCRELSHNSELENSIDLELTFLLSSITQFSSSFSSTLKYSTEESSQKFDTSTIQVEKFDTEVTSINNENYSNQITSLKSNLVKGTITEGGNLPLGLLMREKLERSLNELSNCLSLSIDSDNISPFQTPERMEDISLVEQKLQFLMENLDK